MQMAYSGYMSSSKANFARTALAEAANPLLDVRRNNLRALREQRGAEALAKELQLKSTSYLSQLVHRHRAITERTARAWEKRLGLAPYWFDKEHEEFSEKMPIDVDLFTRVAEMIDAISVAKPLSNRQRATIIATCITLKRSDPAYVNMLVSLTQA